MDAALQRLLDELARMEARLTGALAGRCGEQSARARTPSSDDGSTPSYLAPTSEAVDKLRPDLDPCCAYRDSIQHHRVEDPSAEDLQAQAEVVESFESESAPPPVVYDRYDEPNRDEIAEVLALLEYNEGTSSATVLVDYTTTSKSPTKCSTMDFPDADNATAQILFFDGARNRAVADVPAVHSALKVFVKMLNGGSEHPQEVTQTSTARCPRISAGDTHQSATSMPWLHTRALRSVQLPSLRGIVGIAQKNGGPDARSPVDSSRSWISSEFEHSSIPATNQKIFNLSPEDLTKRDAWAGTFDHIFTELGQPRRLEAVGLPCHPRHWLPDFS